MVTQEHLSRLREALHDAKALLEIIHTRQTTGRGPSYRAYSGQVASWLRDASNILNNEDV